MPNGTNDPDHRPSPEALLAAAEQEGRGRLKIYLGAAPGVGKTYTMLEAAQVRKQEGVDVVVGVVETHGRPETEALLAGAGDHAATPDRIPWEGFEEMDLDAILARRPQLVLVDELAHTNIPGSRHPKRYLDVEEILAAGIDVYTTLNIQHLESLNDAVAQITGIRVRETIPDRILDEAAEVELVDLSPDELLQRLREGKVYVPEQAQRAIQRFFRLGNLRPCASCPCGGPQSASMSRCRPTCRPMPSRAHGRPASASWCVSAPARSRLAWFGRPAAWPTAATPSGWPSTSKPHTTIASPMPTATGWPDVAPGRATRGRSRDHPGTQHGRGSDRLCAIAQRDGDRSSASRAVRAGARCGGARSSMT